MQGKSLIFFARGKFPEFSRGWRISVTLCKAEIGALGPSIG